MKHITKIKKGAASFYVVAFSTLILLIIAASFTALIIAQITRTSNDDLSQSAYDSALAGVEDGKLAYYAYQDCLANMEGEGCNNIISIMESSQEDGQGGVNECDGVSRVLRGGDYSGEVIIKESEGAENNMQQAYTCVKVITTPKDYEGSLSSTNPMRVVRAKFDEVEANASSIKFVKVSWASNKDEAENYNNFGSDGVQFPSVEEKPVANPPTIAVALLQASDSFVVNDLLSKTNDGQTDRGMVYLVPVNNDSLSNNENNNYRMAVKDENNNYKIPAEAMLNSNAQMAQNKPYVVKCNNDNRGYLCSALIGLPDPIGGERSDENFVIAVMLPYGGPSTDFSLEFYKEQTDIGPVSLKGVQIAIDSTGRANDIYRRVEVRLEGKDNNNLSIMGPLELSGDEGNGGGTGAALKKESTVCEWTVLFGGPTC